MPSSIEAMHFRSHGKDGRSRGSSPPDGVQAGWPAMSGGRASWESYERR